MTTAERFAVDQVTTAAKQEHLEPLDQTHPHWRAMFDNNHWCRWRAILNAFEGYGEKAAFLPAADFETTANRDFRRSISHFQGVSPDILCQLFGAVFGTDPVITAEAEDTQEFIEECFVGGLLGFMESKAEEVAAMGVGFIYVDAMIEGGIEEPTSRAQEGSARPFLRYIPAEQVDDWDRSDRPQWVRVRRVVTDRESATSKAKFYLEKWVIDSEETTIHRKEIREDQVSQALSPNKFIPGAYRVHKTVRHRLGRLPLVVWQAIPRGHFEGDSFIKAASRFDIAHFNTDSWQCMAVYRHAHPMPIFRGEEKPQQVTNGSNAAFWLRAGEEFYYATVPIDSFDARESILERLRRNGEKAGGVNAETSDTPSSAASGISLRVRWSQRQKKQIDNFARTTERAAREIVELADLYLSGQREVREGIEVSFSSTHEITEASDEIREYQTIGPDIQSESWHVEKLIRIARKTLNDIDEETEQKIADEIRSAGMPEPPPSPLS